MNLVTILPGYDEIIHLFREVKEGPVVDAALEVVSFYKRTYRSHSEDSPASLFAKLREGNWRVGQINLSSPERFLKTLDYITILESIIIEKPLTELRSLLFVLENEFKEARDEKIKGKVLREIEQMKKYIGNAEAYQRKR